MRGFAAIAHDVNAGAAGKKGGYTMLLESAKRQLHRLPSPANERASRIVGEAEALRSSIEGMLERRHVLQSTIATGEQWIKDAKSGGVTDGDRRRGLTDAELQIDLERLAIQRRDLTELDAQIAERTPRAAGLRRLIDEIVLVAAVPPGRALKPFKGQEASPRKGEDLRAAFDRCERSIASLNAEIEEIANAPVTASAAKARARAQIEELAERGRPNVHGLIWPDERGIAWPEVEVAIESANLSGLEGEVPPESGAPAMVVDTLALFAWLNRDKLVTAIDAQIAAEADDKGAIDPAQKKTAIEKIKAQIAALERDAAQLFYQSIAEGIAIVPIEGMNVKALLGLDNEYANVPLPPYEKKGVELRRPGVSAPVHLTSLPDAEKRSDVWQ